MQKTLRTFDSPSQALKSVNLRIAEAATRAGRLAADITLLAVSKRHSAAAIATLADQGQRDFGENYVSEALEKIAELDDPRLIWHFIGPIQSNKTSAIARHFSWVHSIDRSKILRRLSQARGPDQPPLQCCIQVNLDGEDSKSGVPEAQAGALLEEAEALPGIKLQGLMCIPRPRSQVDEQQAVFARLRQLRERLRSDSLPLPVLSMGMSGDLEAAIAEGATIVRVGTALFGPRPAKPTQPHG